MWIQGDIDCRAFLPAKDAMSHKPLEMLSARPSVLGLEPSFGFGDRLGCATPGHIAALRDVGGSIKGIFAQQSIRELTRTHRTPNDVMQSAITAIEAESFSDVWGADADHIKTPADAQATAAAGFTFFTIDPSEHVDRRADNYDLPTLETKYAEIRDQVDWVESYLGRSVKVPNGPTIEFDRPTVIRAAVKYGRTIAHSELMGECLGRAAATQGRPYELELSVDETDQPTSLAEHYIFADQMLRRGMPLVSLAPRFIGDFEKGVDFKGDLAAFSASLVGHAAIAKLLGPYKISLHSGSDKLSIYPCFARATAGLFHVKTAGTSYMEALRVVAKCAPEVFRQIVALARQHYDVDKATYHVSATVIAIPRPEEIADNRELEKLYLEHWSDVPEGRGFTSLGRQILHCTFGSILTDEKFGALVRQVVRENLTLYRQVLHEHFTRHLQALNAGL